MAVERKFKHLEFIQGVINRLGVNSFRVKGWSVVLVSALFVLAAREGIGVSVIALIPLLCFWGLDGYYLWQERLFRALYDHVRELDESDIDFSMNLTPFKGRTPPVSVSSSRSRPRTWSRATFSGTLLAFYVALIVTAIVVVVIYPFFNGGSS